MIPLGPQQQVPQPPGVLLFDIETNGLLEELTTCHVLVFKHLGRKQTTVCSDGPQAHMPVAEGARLLLEHTQAGGIIAGHNAIKFDYPALRKLFPWFTPDPATVWDTMVLARLIYPDLIEVDSLLVKKGVLPGNMQKRHSLESWGYRLGDWKGDYWGDPLLYEALLAQGFPEAEAMKRTKATRWERWNQAMEDYCVQDVAVTHKLWDKLWSKDPALESVELETGVAHILARQERHGFCFDKAGAAKLYSRLVKIKLEIEAELAVVFKPRYFKDGPEMAPRRDNKTAGYLKDVPLQKVKLVEFNPSSRDHIALWLKALYGWRPEEYTAEGKPKVDETVLSGLPFPEAQVFKKYLIVTKRLGQIAEGKEAWLRHEKAGRIHGQVVTNGAVTGRMSHSRPNMAQVPAGYSPYGEECRALFGVPEGKVLVGADAAALELRDLAGYMARYDGGAYVETVLKGDKQQGTDIHSVNARALGLDPLQEYFDGETGRDLAKTWFYAFIYGAGDEKMGLILTKKKGDTARKVGAKSRAAFKEALPALGKLVEKVKATVRERGFLRGLDGRVLYIRSQHAALNTLLQSAGAVQMKRALVILDRDLQLMGYAPGVNYEFVANVHDEWQIEADQDKGAAVGKAAVNALRKAGESFQFRCPLDGEYRVGRTWAETH